MTKSRVPREILRKVRLVTGKRSRVVVEHILKYGSVTTEDIENYGYKHPPRAIRDVREQGLPLERFWTKNSEGRKIAGFRFGNPSDIRNDRVGGRIALSKDFQKKIIEANNCECAICHTIFADRYLQIDHRVPYEIAGDSKAQNRNASDYMPLCGSCNRAKSWSCEHCANWMKSKNPEICINCYWANPTAYTHIAMRQMRRLDIVWDKQEVGDYDALATSAREYSEPMPDYVKNVLRKHLKQKKTKKDTL